MPRVRCRWGQTEMNTKIVHVFYDVYLGFSYNSLREVMFNSAKKATLAHGEAAVFLNKAWTGCKILYPDGLMLYYRPGTVIAPEQIRSLPGRIGKGRYTFAGSSEASLVRTSEAKFEKLSKKLKVVYA